jgi:hypothetical protein
MRATFQQRHIQIIFHAFDLAAQGWLRQIQTLGGTTDVAIFGGSDE